MSYHKENFIDSLFQIAMKKNEYEFTFYKAGTHPLSVFPKETKWKEAIFPFSPLNNLDEKRWT